MTSMTGYGFREIMGNAGRVCAEIKSYNSRFLDISLFLPPSCTAFEKDLRKTISSSVFRGKIEVFIRIKDESPAYRVVINEALALSYARSFASLSEKLSFENLCAKSTATKNLSKGTLIESLIRQEGVVSLVPEQDLESLQDLITQALGGALEDFIADREREGEELKKDLMQGLAQLERSWELFKQRQPESEAAFRSLISSRFEEITGAEADSQRVLTEVAALIIKYTINEEVVRLKAHLDALRNEICVSKTPGRKIDFLCQEIQRELNTIGSKSQFADISAEVVRAKDALENIREQARNVE